MIKWTHQGLIYNQELLQKNWSMTHAQVPTAIILNDYIRVFYATRDVNNQSRTSFVDFNIDNPTQIEYQNDGYILELGDAGTFDENGVMVSSVVEFEDKIFLYYTGWKKNINVPYAVSIGLAISEDYGQTFHRYSKGPILGMNSNDPLITMSPDVKKDSEGWHMWYGSGITWKFINNKYEPIYVIKYAFSDNGINWETSKNHCFPTTYDYESNVRPSIIKTSECYEMYFCHRGTYDFRNGKDSYKIGKAKSLDRKTWERDVNFVNFNIPLPEYAKRMLAYPNILDINNTYYCFVNGDGFGKNGFGLITGTKIV
jgi:hypothetical protein